MCMRCRECTICTSTFVHTCSRARDIFDLWTQRLFPLLFSSFCTNTITVYRSTLLPRKSHHRRKKNRTRIMVGRWWERHTTNMNLKEETGIDLMAYIHLFYSVFKRFCAVRKSIKSFCAHERRPFLWPLLIDSRSLCPALTLCVE